MLEMVKASKLDIGMMGKTSYKGQEMLIAAPRGEGEGGRPRKRAVRCRLWKICFRVWRARLVEWQLPESYAVERAAGNSCCRRSGHSAGKSTLAILAMIKPTCMGFAGVSLSTSVPEDQL